MRRRPISAALAVALGAFGCASDPDPVSTVELAVSFPSDLAVDQLVLTAELPMSPARSVRAEVPATPRALDPSGETVTIALPEAIDSEFTLVVEGMSSAALVARHAVRVAAGASTVVAALVPVESSSGGACGDGLLDEGEACDDGGLEAGDGCNSTCGIESGWACSGAPSTCAPDCEGDCASCGDGVVDADEGCDDGARVSGDGCNVVCAIEAGYNCLGSPSNCVPVCGDGLVRSPEGCDDEDRRPGDGCNLRCEVESGWACAGEPSSCAPVCGDGQILGDEACDDEGLEAGDGCSADCTIEDGYACDGEPSVCVSRDVDAGVAEDAGFVELDAGEDASVPDEDAGFATDAGFEVEAGVEDAGFAVDAGFATDAGFAVDAGFATDAGFAEDATVPDSGFAEDAGFADATVPDATVYPADAWHFDALGAAVTAGDCTPVVLRRLDASGNPTTELIARTAQLSLLVGADAALHDDASCSTQLFSVTMPAGASERTLYLRADTAGPFEIEATTTGLDPGQLTGTVLGAAPHSVAVIGGPSTFDWNVCSTTTLRIELTDVFGNVASNSAVQTLTLTTDPPGALVFSTQSACNQVSTTVQIDPGTSAVTRYIMPARSGTIDVQLAAGGLASATTQLVVNPAAGACGTCATGFCAESGSGDPSSVFCPDRCACHLDCGAVPNECQPTCGDRSICELDCEGRTRCEALCEARSSCVVSCDGTPDCDRVDCEARAECMLDCGSSTSCAFRTCAAGQMTCPDNVVVCNRACP